MLGRALPRPAIICQFIRRPAARGAGNTSNLSRSKLSRLASLWETCRKGTNPTNGGYCMLKHLMLAAAALAAAAPACAQEKYPSRPVEIVVPWGPGGGADQLGRLTSKIME